MLVTLRRTVHGDWLRRSLVAAGGVIGLFASHLPASAGSAEPGPQPANIAGWPVSRLIGATVETDSGEVVGAVDDLIIDPGEGRVRMVVIGLAGALGLGEKDVAIPYSSVAGTRVDRASPQRQAFSGTGLYAGSSGVTLVVAPDMAALRAAPAFKASEGQDAEGRPSAGSGVPESVGQEPKSSTQSGGPG